MDKEWQGNKVRQENKVGQRNGWLHQQEMTGEVLDLRQEMAGKMPGLGQEMAGKELGLGQEMTSKKPDLGQETAGKEPGLGQEMTGKEPDLRQKQHMGVGKHKGCGVAVRLSKRLEAVAGMVTEGNIVCDVGCDHGFVSIYLVQKNISPRAIAMDVNNGPLQAAKEHILDYGLQSYIETRLSNGVEALKAGEADSLICAGMGGRLVIRILEAGKSKIQSMKEIILQPQSEIPSVREYLRKEGYRIVDENMILEEEKFYPVIKAKPVQEAGTGKVEIVSRQGMGGSRNAEAGQDMEESQNAEGGQNMAESRNAEGGQNITESQGTKAEQHAAGNQHVEDKYGPVLLVRRNPVLEIFLHREYDLCMEIMEKLRRNGKDERQEEIAGRIKDIEQGLAYFIPASNEQGS